MGVKIRFRKGAWWDIDGERWIATYPALAGLRQSTVEGHRLMLKLHVYRAWRKGIRGRHAGRCPRVDRGADRAGQESRPRAPSGGANSRRLQRARASLQLPSPTGRIGRFIARPRRSVPADRSLTVADEAQLLATPRELLPRHFSFLLYALRTGMRLGDLCGLQWGNLDFEGRFIEVRRSLVDGARIELRKKWQIRCVDLLLIFADTCTPCAPAAERRRLRRMGGPT